MCNRLFYVFSWVLRPESEKLLLLSTTCPLLKFISHTGCGGNLPTRPCSSWDCREVCSVLSGSELRLIWTWDSFIGPSNLSQHRRICDRLSRISYRTRGVITAD